MIANEAYFWKKRRTSTKVPHKSNFAVLQTTAAASATGSAQFKIDLKIGLIKVESFQVTPQAALHQRHQMQHQLQFINAESQVL